MNPGPENADTDASGADVSTTPGAEASRNRVLEELLASERRVRSRLAMLADVGQAMTEIEPRAALQRLAEVLAESPQGPVTWCAVLEVDDEVEVSAAAGVELRRPQERFRPGSNTAARPAADVEDPLRDLRSRVHHSLVELDPVPEAYAEGTLTRWVVDQIVTDGGEWLALAAPGRRGVRCVLLLGVPELPLDADDVDLLGEIARRVGLSLDNARLYAREHLVAETLQRSMLPELTTLPGLDVWSYYAPGTEHAQVGGDWYDLIRLGDGAVGVVIGDVVGHDIEAASAMGQLRSVVRAYAADGEEPGPVLMRVDQLVGGMRISRSASMVYATLTDVGDGVWEMAWTRAGHLPPIVVHDGQAEALMDAGGPMVGHASGPRESPVRLLQPGDVLVLYTDGLIERRARPMKAGLEQLLQVCSELEDVDAAGVGERLLAALGDFPEDDLALVVVRVPVPGHQTVAGTGQRLRRWQLPGEASSIPRARALTVQVCELWGLDVAREAELAVSELVANAVLHGYGPVGLRLREDDGLLIEVEDANPTPPEQVDGHAGRTGGFGMTIVATFAEWGWRPEGTSKVVWARVRAPRSARTDHD